MAVDERFTYTMHIEVYLQAAMVRGILQTNQDRLSNDLIVRQGEEVFSLREATVESAGGKPIKTVARENLIYMQEVFVIADLSAQNPTERAGFRPAFVKKDQSRALLGIGPYLVQGTIHLLLGSGFHEFLMEQSRFLPVTAATLVDREEMGQRTFLINRAKIGFISAVHDG
jgi:hypothetical protein